MPTKDYNLEQLARLVLAERPRFAQIYDPLAAKHGGKSLMMLSYLYEPPPPGAPAFLVAFERANQEGWVDELFSELLAGKAMEDSPIHEQMVLEKVARRDEGFQDVGLQSAGGEKAKRRVCMLTVQLDGRTTQGSGFLVGPQMILTSWHVIENLLDPTDPTKGAAGSHACISVQFDYRTGATPVNIGVSQEWLVASSEAHVRERGQVENAFSADMPAVDFDKCLDYAVIRLAIPVGRERGYYRLDQRRKPELASPVTIYQHPIGHPLKSALGVSLSVWPDAVETRLRHDANTAGGASGGLVLDRTFEPVALHQGGIILADKRIFNSAIPTSCIAALVETFDSVTGVDPIWRLERGGWPVFSRTDFQKCILECLVGRTRIVIVRGEPRSGKSFTTAILRDRLGQAEHSVVELSSRHAPTGAREMACSILEKAGVAEAKLAALPMPGDADTASDAWVRDVLVREFLSLLKAQADTRQVWIVIDDLDVAPLPQTDSLVFIERLLSSIEDNDFLRFILIGGARYTTVCPPALTQIDDVTPAQLMDVKDTIERRANAPGNIWDEDPLTLARAIVKFAKGGPGRYMDELVGAYRRIVEAA